MTDKTYDILKVVALIVLPLAAFITSLSEIWNIPYGPQISQTLIALDALIGALLHKSSKDYWGGQYDELDAADEDHN